MRTRAIQEQTDCLTEGNEVNEGESGRTTRTRVGGSASWWAPLRSLRFLLFKSVRPAVLFVAVALFPADNHGQAIEAWAQRYDMNLRPSGSWPVVGLAVDADTNVFLLCPSQRDYLVEGYEIHDWATVKYSSSGVPVWTNLHGAVDYGGWPRALTVDSSGNLLVTGTEYGWGVQYCGTVKYASDGALLWARNAGSGEGRAVAVDRSGNVCVAASANNGLIKYSSAGDILWSKGSDYDIPAAVATDADDSVVVVGSSATIVKYSNAGVPLWTRTCGELSFARFPLALDSGGNVLVTGDGYSPGLTTHDFVTLKYSGAGVPLWTNRYDGPAKGSDYPSAVAVDASGDVYVTGEAEVSGTIADYVTIKYTSSGVPVWTNSFNGPGNWLDHPFALAVDSAGHVFVTGVSYYTGGNASVAATVAYSSSGVPLWTNLCNRPGNLIGSGEALAVDADGGAYVAGPSLGSDGKLELAVVKYVTTLVIAHHPLSCTNGVGTTARFGVEVAGRAPFTYQWRRDGTNLVDGGNIFGVATTNLLVTSVQPADAAGYSVVVTNAYGSVTSRVARLTVTIPPSPGRFTNFSYSPTMGFSFIFRDGMVGQPYRIQRSPSAAPGTWVDWQSFTYTEPNAFMDLGATGLERRFYRTVSP